MISIDASGGELSDKIADLPVRVVAGGVEQGCGQLDFQRFRALDEIDDRSLGNGQRAEQLVGCLHQST